MFPIVVLILLLAALPTAAQSVYKCTVAGKVSYGDQPCADAVVTELLTPAATPADPASASSLQRQKALLAGLEKQRHKREAAQERIDARIDKAAAAQARRCAKLRLQQQWAQQDLAQTEGKGKDALRKKAERQRQGMRLECPG